VTAALKPSRVDWLTATWFVLYAGQSIAAVILVIQVALVVTGSAVQVDLPLAAVGGVTDAGHTVIAGRPDDHVTVGPDTWMQVWIKEPTVGQSLLGIARTVPTVAVVMAMLTVLCLVVYGARHADPFSVRNVRLLRVLGITVLIGGLLAEIAQLLASRALIAPLVDNGQLGDIRIGWWWLAGLAFLAIAEVVRKGLAMRTELDGVI
jgi:hypothetical protein